MIGWIMFDIWKKVAFMLKHCAELKKQLHSYSPVSAATEPYSGMQMYF